MSTTTIATQGSLAARALLAVILMIAFYILAVGIVAVLFWLPYAEYMYMNRLDARVALFCVVAGGAVLWSIVPRIDRFTPPGPLLSRDEQPRLFGVIEEVAALTGQAMPSQAYLIPEVNAWVAQRGGVIGIGSRRVMGIGLPLLHALTIDEFRAVLGHEFGHFYSGDTKLGPWVYKTQAAIGRTIGALESDESIALQIVQGPFRAYGAMFLRVTKAVSRAQELAADRLSARVVGAGPLASGLKTIHAVAPGFGGYWSSEVVPLLNAGAVAPLGEGFQRYLGSEKIQQTASAHLAAVIEQLESNPLDTHPALKLRLEALGQSAAPVLPPPGPRAATLLDDEPGLESRLLEFFFGEKASEFVRVPWDEAGREIYGAYVVREAAAAAPQLQGVKPGYLFAIATQFHVSNDRLVRAKPGDTYFGDQGARATAYLGSALTVAAVQAGGAIVSRPGSPMLVRVDGEEIDFYSEFAKLRTRKTDKEQWDRLVAKAGIAEVNLGGLQASSGTPRRDETGV